MGTEKSRGAKSPCVSLHVDQHVPKFSYFLEHGNIFGQEHQYFAPLAHKSAYMVCRAQVLLSEAFIAAISVRSP